MRVILNQKAFEATLPQVTMAAVVSMIATGMRCLPPFHKAAQNGFRFRLYDDMEMVRHQAEAKHPDRELGFRYSEQVEKCLVVSVLVKDDRAAVAAIKDMKDRTGRLFAERATHQNDMTLRGEESTKMMSDTFLGSLRPLRQRITQ